MDKKFPKLKGTSCFFMLGGIFFVLFMYIFYILSWYPNTFMLDLIYSITGIRICLPSIFKAINAPVRIDWLAVDAVHIVLLHVYWILIGGVLVLLFKIVFSSVIIKSEEKRRVNSEILLIFIASIILLSIIVTGNMLAVAKIKRIPLINTNAEGRHLENNANPNIKVSLGNPLMQACQKNNFVAVKLLIERGDNVNFANITKNTPIMYTSDLKIVNYLVSKGADVNASDRYQETVLMSFLNKDIPVDEKIKIMSFLIEHGADVNAVANQDEFEVGQTILDIAIFQKYPKELIDFLRKHGAKTAEELKQEKNPESKN